MKTTVEIPDALFRKAKSAAARDGQTFKQLVQDALSEKLARAEGKAKGEKPWMVMAGGLKHLKEENERIRQVIEDEFEKIEPALWK